MYQIYNLTKNPNVKIAGEMGPFTVIVHLQDLGVPLNEAQRVYYAGLLHQRRRQLICNLAKSNVIVEQGKMQWMVGNCQIRSDVTGVGDWISKSVKGKLTNQAPVRPLYTGTGMVVLEPCFNDILLVDLDDWNGSIVLGAGMFLACEAGIKQKFVWRNTVSSAAMGNEGLFNLALHGSGIAALQIPIPREELVEVILENDVLKIDGHFAVAWSESLIFTVEKAAQTLIGSALTDEGFVNTYSGTGKVLLAPFITAPLTDSTAV
jgi:uncharacterized protein (AIM24 family)